MASAYPRRSPTCARTKDAAILRTRSVRSASAPATSPICSWPGSKPDGTPKWANSDLPVRTGVAVKIGYARVSTAAQNPEAQVNLLREAGCERYYVDWASGISTARPQFHQVLDVLRPGDELMVVKLDRMSRSVPDAVDLLDRLRRREVRFVSLTEGIDTGTPLGKAIYLIAAIFAELERDLIRERTLLGQATSRANGRHGGRRPTVTPAKLALARRMLAERSAVKHIAEVLGVSRPALYRVLGPDIKDARSRERP